MTLFFFFFRCAFYSFVLYDGFVGFHRVHSNACLAHDHDVQGAVLHFQLVNSLLISFFLVAK